MARVGAVVDEGSRTTADSRQALLLGASGLWARSMADGGLSLVAVLRADCGGRGLRRVASAVVDAVDCGRGRRLWIRCSWTACGETEGEGEMQRERRRERTRKRCRERERRGESGKTRRERRRRRKEEGGQSKK